MRSKSKRHSDATLLHMRKKELLEYVRMCEQNQEVAEESLRIQGQNIQDMGFNSVEKKLSYRELEERYRESIKLLKKAVADLKRFSRSSGVLELSDLVEFRSAKLGAAGLDLGPRWRYEDDAMKLIDELEELDFYDELLKVSRNEGSENE